MGVSVLILSQVGNGAPDLLLGFRGKNYLVEIKSKNGKLRQDQKEFIDEWRGQATMAKTLDQVRKVIND